MKFFKNNRKNLWKGDTNTFNKIQPTKIEEQTKTELQIECSEWNKC